MSWRQPVTNFISLSVCHKREQERTAIPVSFYHHRDVYASVASQQWKRPLKFNRRQ